MWYINTSIQHLENIHELLICHDVEWPVSVSTPHCKEVSKTCHRVRYTICKGFDLLRFQDIGWVATPLVIKQVLCRVFKASMRQKFAWVPIKFDQLAEMRLWERDILFANKFILDLAFDLYDDGRVEVAIDF
jgi:hypothetical protein